MDILFGNIHLNGGICIAQRINRQCPLTASIASFRQRAAQGVGQSQLNAVPLMHPVICCKLGSVGSQRCTCCGTIILPHNCLHRSAQISIIALQIYADEITVRARLLYGNTQICLLCCLLFLSLDTGTGSCLSCPEGECISVFLCHLQAVGIFVYFSDSGISIQLIFAESTCQSAAVFDHVILCLEVLIICSLHCHRHILDALDLIVIHSYGRTVSLRDRSTGEAAVCAIAVHQVQLLTICLPDTYPVRISVGVIHHGILLEIAAVQTMNGRCTGNRIKSTQVGLISRIFSCACRCGACCLHILCCVVLCIRQCCVYIGVLVLHLLFQLFHSCGQSICRCSYCFLRLLRIQCCFRLCQRFCDLIFRCAPALFCIISFLQCLCFCDSSFQCCGVNRHFRRFFQLLNGILQGSCCCSHCILGFLCL